MKFMKRGIVTYIVTDFYGEYLWHIWTIFRIIIIIIIMITDIIIIFIYIIIVVVSLSLSSSWTSFISFL